MVMGCHQTKVCHQSHPPSLALFLMPIFLFFFLVCVCVGGGGGGLFYFIYFFLSVTSCSLFVSLIPFRVY